MSFGPASPDAGVELLRQLFLQCRDIRIYLLFCFDRKVAERGQSFKHKSAFFCDVERSENLYYFLHNIYCKFERILLFQYRSKVNIE